MAQSPTKHSKNTLAYIDSIYIYIYIYLNLMIISFMYL